MSLLAYYLLHEEHKIRYSTFLRLVILASTLWAALACAAPPKVNMLVGEMKNEQGNPIPLLKEWRRIFNVVEQDIGVEFDMLICGRYGYARIEFAG